MKVVEILGVKVSAITLDETFKKIEEFIADSKKHRIVSTNTEAITQSLHNPEFKEVINTADLSLADTYGVLYAAKYQDEISKCSVPVVIRSLVYLLIGLKVGVLGVLDKKYFDVVPQAISGSDFLFDVLSHYSASLQPFSIYLVGSRYPNGSEGAADAMEILKKKYPKINFVGAVSAREQKSDGSYDFVDERDVLNKINSDLEKARLANVDLAFVCFRQIIGETWIRDTLSKLPFKVTMGIGSAFDYVNGRQKRAPHFFRRLHLEWFFRFFADPSLKRLKRILWAFPVFPILVYLDSLKK